VAKGSSWPAYPDTYKENVCEVGGQAVRRIAADAIVNSCATPRDDKPDAATGAS